MVIDGFCRDVAGLRRVGLPVFARGTMPRSGTTLSRAPVGDPVACGGIDVAAGDLVFGDDDGVVIAPAARIEAALATAERIGAAEHAMLGAMATGRPLHELTSYREHVAALDAGHESTLEFRVGA